MKISIVFTEGAKQIMMTPETPHEKTALSYIAPNDVLKTVSKPKRFMGTFADDPSDHVSYQIYQCKGGYYRAFETADSLMFVIEEPKNKKEEK